MVRRDEDAHPADADEDTQDLGDVIAHAQEEEREHDDHHDRPEVDELDAEHGGVRVCQHHEVVALDVAEGQDDVFPAVAVHQAEPALDAVTVHRVGSEDGRQQGVVEQCLESGDGPFLSLEEGREGARRRVGNGEQLSTMVSVN